MTTLLIRVSLFLFVGVIASCGSNTPDAQTGPYMEITHLAGTTPDMDWNFLPYPGHFGKIKDYPTLLISKAPCPGQERSIIPIGIMDFEIEGTSHAWLIANDAHESYKIEGLDTIDDLMTAHNGIKSTLERWVANHQGIGAVMLKGWREPPSLSDLNNH